MSRAKRKPAVVADAPVVSGLEGLVGYNLKRAYVVVQEDFRAALGENGLSARVFSALTLTVENPNITQSALARQLGIERSGLVAIVDDLEAKGYLKRTAVPGDRRVQALVPTPLGKGEHSKLTRTVQAHEDQLFSDMTAQEKATLLDLLKKIRGVGDEG